MTNIKPIVIALVSRNSVSLAEPGHDPGTHGRIFVVVRSGLAAYAWARAKGFTIQPGALLPEDAIIERIRARLTAAQRRFLSTYCLMTGECDETAATQAVRISCRDMGLVEWKHSGACAITEAGRKVLE
jgi:hypothetical protein